MICGAGIGYLILLLDLSVGAWRWMYASDIIPAVLLGRFTVTESPHWLYDRGQNAKAEREAKRLLNRVPEYPREVHLRERQPDATADSLDEDARRGFGELFSRRRQRATILASVPWFLQDLVTYGIGIFTPIILAATFGHKAADTHNVSALVTNDMLAAQGTVAIDLLFIVGIIFAVRLTERFGRIRLQIVGFIGAAVDLIIAALSSGYTGDTQFIMM